MVFRVGMDLATVQVRVENLKVEADIAVGSRGNPTVTNTLCNIAEVGFTDMNDLRTLTKLCWMSWNDQHAACPQCQHFIAGTGTSC